MPATEVTEARLDLTLAQKGWVLVSFCGAWSGPCCRFAPVFEAAADQHPDIVFGTVDTGREQGLETRFDITAVPTVIAFFEGRVVVRYAGALSHAELEWAIAKLPAVHLDRPSSTVG